MRAGIAVYLLFLSATGYIPVHTIRYAVYKICGLKLGKNSTIYAGAEIRSPKSIVIGNNTMIGSKAILDGRGKIEIGHNVNYSTGVWLWTAQHDKNDPFFSTILGKIVIEDYAWISCRVIFLPNVIIGRSAVVCAGAVVTKDVPPYTVVGGVPARILSKRTENLKYTLSSIAARHGEAKPESSSPRLARILKF